MAGKKSFFTSFDITLIIGIVVFGIFGVVYAGVTGIASVPGVPAVLAPKIQVSPRHPAVTQANLFPTPSLSPSPSPVIVSPGSSNADGTKTTVVQADSQPTPTPSPLASVVPTPKVNVSPTPSPVSSPTPSPVPSLTPSPVSSPSPVASPIASPTPDAQTLLKQRDQTRKNDLATLQVALNQYYKKHKTLPSSTSYYQNRTNSLTSSLKVLVTENYLKSLPLDPRDPDYWYGYKASGATYTITSRLEDTSDPTGHYDDRRVYLYAVTGP